MLLIVIILYNKRNYQYNSNEVGKQVCERKHIFLSDFQILDTLLVVIVDHIEQFIPLILNNLFIGFVIFICFRVVPNVFKTLNAQVCTVSWIEFCISLFYPITNIY